MPPASLARSVLKPCEVKYLRLSLARSVLTRTLKKKKRKKKEKRNRTDGTSGTAGTAGTAGTIKKN